uniref:Uncharacterized protein n=1 Tax=Aegilops tauschii subsp. strangulata TaxID=200361 RepID=A0A452ZEV6_AEGTS
MLDGVVGATATVVAVGIMAGAHLLLPLPLTVAQEAGVHLLPLLPLTVAPEAGEQLLLLVLLVTTQDGAAPRRPSQHRILEVGGGLAVGAGEGYLLCSINHKLPTVDLSSGNLFLCLNPVMLLPSAVDG